MSSSLKQGPALNHPRIFRMVGKSIQDYEPIDAV